MLSPTRLNLIFSRAITSLLVMMSSSHPVSILSRIRLRNGGTMLRLSFRSIFADIWRKLLLHSWKKTEKRWAFFSAINNNVYDSMKIGLRKKRSASKKSAGNGARRTWKEDSPLARKKTSTWFGRRLQAGETNKSRSSGRIRKLLQSKRPLWPHLKNKLLNWLLPSGDIKFEQIKKPKVTWDESTVCW